MATKSMLKNVDIKDRKLGKQLVLALEHASEKKSKTVSLSRTYKEVKGDKVKDIFQKIL